jgi:hypothetical protein
MIIFLRIIVIAIISFTFIMTSGCSKKKGKVTGFLTDYIPLSHHEWKNGSLSYVDMQRLGTYSRFIIEPVNVRVYGARQSSKMDRETQTALANYFHNAIVNAVGDRYEIVSQPAPGVALLRIAITDIESSVPSLTLLPHSQISGAGLGSASMEAELLDSQSREQIGAIIERQKGSRFSLDSIKQWGDAKSVMDDWAKRFRKRIDEAHK